MIGRSPKHRILSRNVPIIPDKAAGVIGPRIGETLFEMSAQLPGFWIEAIDDYEILAGTHVRGSIQRLTGRVHCSAGSPMVSSALQNSGHGDVAFTLAQLGIVMWTGLAVYVLPAIIATGLWLREERTRIRIARQSVREVYPGERRDRAA